MTGFCEGIACLCERLIVLRACAFAASREIQQGPVSREGAKPKHWFISASLCQEAATVAFFLGGLLRPVAGRDENPKYVDCRDHRGKGG